MSAPDLERAARACGEAAARAGRVPHPTSTGRAVLLAVAVGHPDLAEAALTAPDEDADRALRAFWDGVRSGSAPAADPPRSPPCCPTCGRPVPPGSKLARMAEALERGATPAEVASLVGLSERQVQRVAIVLGLARPRGRPRRPPADRR